MIPACSRDYWAVTAYQFAYRVPPARRLWHHAAQFARTAPGSYKSHGATTSPTCQLAGQLTSPPVGKVMPHENDSSNSCEKEASGCGPTPRGAPAEAPAGLALRTAIRPRPRARIGSALGPWNPLEAGREGFCRPQPPARARPCPAAPGSTDPTRRSPPGMVRARRRAPEHPAHPLASTYGAPLSRSNRVRELVRAIFCSASCPGPVQPRVLLAPPDQGREVDRRQATMLPNGSRPCHGVPGRGALCGDGAVRFIVQGTKAERGVACRCRPTLHRAR